MTKPQAGEQRNRGLIAGMDKRFLPSPESGPDPEPTQLPVQSVPGLEREMSTHLRLVQRLGINGAVAPLPLCPQGEHRDNTFTMKGTKTTWVSNFYKTLENLLSSIFNRRNSLSFV
jgi:hypothetical protein